MKKQAAGYTTQRQGGEKGMKIDEAVKIALETGKCITLPEWEENAKIRPTNDKGNCIVMDADGSHPSEYGWQPTAAQLMRDDWIITEGV